MADPVTWVMIIGAVVSAAGQMQAAGAKADQARKAAEVQEYNAVVSKQSADSALNASAQNAAERQRHNNYVLSQQRGSLLQAGIGTEGSALDVIGESAKNLELDALNIRYEGALRAKSYTDQSNLDLMQADALRKKGDDEETAGYIGAGTSLLSSAGSYYGGKAKGKTAGLSTG